MPQSHPDQSDFMRLFVQHERDLRVFARTLLPNWPAVDDVLQEASVVMWKKLHQLEKDEEFFFWARSIVRFEALRARRDAARDRLVLSEETLELLANEAMSVTADDLEQERAALKGCLHGYCKASLGHGDEAREAVQRTNITLWKRMGEFDPSRDFARRLVENGVRFVQLYDWGWDHHGSSLGESIDETLPIKCQQIDRAIAGLITDLKQRGLFDETLIVWGGEFGRTPMMQNNVRNELKKGFYGRDHHPHAFTMWMAGAGVKPGVYGETDDIGYYIGENSVGIRDLQATILHLMGLDPHRFNFPYQGLNQRLIGPTEEGQVVKGILA